VPFQRNRPQEFAQTGMPRAELVGRIEDLTAVVTGVIAALTGEQLDSVYPENAWAFRCPRGNSWCIWTGISTITWVRSTIFAGF